MGYTIQRITGALAARMTYCGDVTSQRDRGRTRRGRRVRRFGMAAQNALEIMRVGRLGTRHGAPFLVTHEDAVYRLRHYEGTPAGRGPGAAAPLVLIPPLMIASDVYDMDPEISAVRALVAAGIDVWLCDFGAPERMEGGMDRTLDDHVRAVSDAVDRVRAATGSDVHLAGYSQGGMFAYQVAALRRSRSLASVITFGSPVDLHRNLPAVRGNLTGRFLGSVRRMIEPVLGRVPGLPGKFTSTGFKVMSARKEVQQFFDFMGKLHNRKELERRESRRLFLGGEGFVAWPGPALRTFIDEFIVQNRMASGGFVIDGQVVTLADIRCPILCFIGSRDDMARPPSVRAIRRAAPDADVYDVLVQAGHFGLVVGAGALQRTWPTVIGWLAWHAGQGAKPAALTATPAALAEDDEDYDAAFDDIHFDLELFADVAKKSRDAVWARLGDAGQALGDTLDNLRWQLPRLARLRSMRPDSRVGIGRALAGQARALPDKTFFLWKGRAFTYADANRRVDNVVRGLVQCGVRRGQRIAVVMRVRPSYLSIVTALNRLGAVAVLVSPELTDESLARCLATAEAQALVTDPDHADRARRVFMGEVLVLGGGPGRELPAAVVDMEAIDPDRVTMPPGFRPNQGRADDLAMMVFTAGRQGAPRVARITNRRWAFSAYGAAATCTLTPRDTIYCPLPLHHMAGALVSAGGALVGGSRLALASSFDPASFWPEVRRYGATVVFYAGDMCRSLVDAPREPGERNHPVRMFAGSGMRKDVWRRLADRFGPVGVLEFYASTEGNAVLANADGDKVGALGRPLPGSSYLTLVAYDVHQRQPMRDRQGRCIPCGVDSMGMLVALIDEQHPMSGVGTERVIEDVFEPGDRWFITGDLMRRDVDGDFWFVDRASDMIVTPAGPVASTEIEDALYTIPGVAQVVAYGLPVPGGTHQMPVCAVVMRDGASLDATALRDAVASALPRQAWPRFVRTLDEVVMTTGYRPLKTPLRAQGISPDAEGVLRYDVDDHVYR